MFIRERLINKFLVFFTLFTIGVISSCSDNHFDEPDSIDREEKKMTFELRDGEAWVTEISDTSFIDIPSEIIVDGYTFPVVGLADFKITNEKLNHLSIPPSIKYIDANFADSQVDNLFIEDLKSWCGIKFKELSYHADIPYIDTESNPMYYSSEVYIDGEPIKNKIVIPDGIEEISDFAFNISKVDTIVIGNDVKRIGRRSFYHCFNISGISLGESVKVIDDEAFPGFLLGLENFRLPDSIEAIGYNTLDCIGTINIPSSLKKLGIYNFRLVDVVNISSLESFASIQYYSSLYHNEEANPDMAFNFFYGYDLALNGELIEELVIPENIETIHSGAFCNVNSLSSVTIQEGVKNLIWDCFSHCDNLERVTIAGSVEETRGFNSNKNLKSVYIEEGARRVSGFSNTPLLEEYFLPSTLEYLSFDLENHENVESLNLYIKAITPPELNLYYGGWSDIPEDVTDNIILHVPEVSIETYRSNPEWGRFTHIINGN